MTEDTTYPARLEVDITSKHLSKGARVNPLEQAVKDAFDREQLPYDKLTVNTDNVYVFADGKPYRRTRYFIPDDLWRYLRRHRDGVPLKPKTFELTIPWRLR